MKNSLIFTSLMFLVGCTEIKLENPRIGLQKDVYIQANRCGKQQVFEHKVVSVNFTIPESLLKNDQLHLEVKDSISNNIQHVYYKKDHYLYPGVFQGIDHKEFNLPECRNSKCEVELYVFLTSWERMAEKLEFQLKASDQKEKELFSYKFPTINNEFGKFSNLIDPNIQISYSNNKIAKIKIPKDDLVKIKKSGVEIIELVFQWRKGKETGYKEMNSLYKLSDQEKIFVFSHTIVTPSYLGGLLKYKRGNLDYEKKVEIINDQNPFYQCKKSKRP